MNIVFTTNNGNVSGLCEMAGLSDEELDERGYIRSKLTALEDAEPIECYELINDTIQLKPDWEEIKADLETQAEGLIKNEHDVYVPQKITARQARLALHNIGKLTAVPAAIASLPDEHRAQAEIEWEYATEFERTDPFITVLAESLGLDSSQIDQLFIDGADLKYNPDAAVDSAVKSNSGFSRFKALLSKKK